MLLLPNFTGQKWTAYPSLICELHSFMLHVESQKSFGWWEHPSMAGLLLWLWFLPGWGDSGSVRRVGWWVGEGKAKRNSIGHQHVQKFKNDKGFDWDWNPKIAEDSRRIGTCSWVGVSSWCKPQVPWIPSLCWNLGTSNNPVASCARFLKRWT